MFNLFYKTFILIQILVDIVTLYFLPQSICYVDFDWTSLQDMRLLRLCWVQLYLVRWS